MHFYYLFKTVAVVFRATRFKLLNSGLYTARKT